jgi:hypothetical protein
MRVDRLTAVLITLAVAAPSIASAQEPAGSVEILDPFVAPRTGTRAGPPELIDPFPARPAAGRGRTVVRATSEILDPFVAGAIVMVSELLDPWAT